MNGIFFRCFQSLLDQNNSWIFTNFHFKSNNKREHLLKNSFKLTKQSFTGKFHLFFYLNEENTLKMSDSSFPTGGELFHNEQKQHKHGDIQSFDSIL